jgi:hypothetical protein
LMSANVERYQKVIAISWVDMPQRPLGITE